MKVKYGALGKEIDIDESNKELSRAELLVVVEAYQEAMYQYLTVGRQELIAENVSLRNDLSYEKRSSKCLYDKFMNFIRNFGSKKMNRRLDEYLDEDWL